MKRLFPFILTTIFILQACGGSAPTEESAAAPQVASTEVAATTADVAPATAEPIVHVDIPNEGTVSRASAHDNEESANSGNKDVIFGDDFEKNRF
ncbi:MAG TPA: hypothetical protein PLL95_11265, partial [Anaerolineales bacterium]|nr:hypothetical protein [Anaerolineales bacterium]